MKTQTKSRKYVHRLGASLRAGFSLVELLVVIAVIGIIAAIAIPNISSITASATDSKIQRNAQQIVSVYNSAMAAGYAGAATETAAITAIEGGTVTGTGNMSTVTFSVPNVQDSAAALSPYIDQPAASGPLVYYPGKNAP
jgi:prepilin-type N-terminal cleavage/methylation domain-containing protein